MKNLSLVLNVVLFVLVIILFVLHFTKPAIYETKPIINDSIVSNKTNDGGELRFASINVEVLLKDYSFYKELESNLLNKQKKLESELSQKMAAFEKEAMEFQRKVQANAFLSMESAQRQEQELMQKQQSLIAWKDEVSMQLVKESQLMESQLLDTVTNFLKDYNKEMNYNIIFNSAAFLHGDESIDITDSVLSILNQRYEKQKSKK